LARICAIDAPQESRVDLRRQMNKDQPYRTKTLATALRRSHRIHALAGHAMREDYLEAVTARAAGRGLAAVGVLSGWCDGRRLSPGQREGYPRLGVG
jgi:hypothetical protein